MQENETNFNDDKKVKKYSIYSDILNITKNLKKDNDMNTETIINRIKYMQNKVQNSCEQLFDEINEKKNRSLITFSEEKNKNNKKKIINKISPFVKKLLKKANNKIDQINQSTLDIAKLNYLYYLNKPSNNVGSKSCADKSRDKDIKIRNIVDDNKNKSIKDYTSKNESDIIKKIRNKSLVKNFVYINNNYHKQLHSAFMKYNPTTHLNNMKILLEAIPSFQDDISREKKEVESDINFKNDKFKFKKKYLNYVNRGNLFSLNKSKNINKSLSLPKIKIKEETKKNNDFKKLNIPLMFINNLKKKKNDDFQKYKENKINELNKLVSISDKINNLIGKSTIDNKIKKFINDYNLVKYEAERKKSDSVDIDLNKIDYFKSEKQLIDNKLKSFYIKKYFNTIDKKEKNLYNQLHSELDIFTNNNISNKNISLNELDNYLVKNNIDVVE